MTITKITASYQETANLGDYSNCRPTATIEVTVGEGENPDLIMAEATAYVRRVVQAQVDDALEANDRPPRYTTEPLYAVFVRHKRHGGSLDDLAVIAPAYHKVGPGFSAYYRGLRLSAIQRLAAEHYGNTYLLDTTIEPEALSPLLAQVAAEDAEIAAEQERQRHEYTRRYVEQKASPIVDEDIDDNDDDDGPDNAL